MSTTTLHDAVNTCISVIGEPALTTANTSTNPNAVIARQIIEEVSRETQSKGWWFNTSGGTITINANASDDFHDDLPEEAVRYITIRSARVMQSRFLSSEELHKFSFNEEQVAFAILSARQAKESGTTTSFTAIPDTVKNMGIEEVLFLQSSAEEKLLTIRLNTELKQGEKLASEKLLTDAQKLAVDEDTKLKKAQQADISADISIKSKQGSLVDAQTTSEGKKATDIEADTTLKGKQGSLIDTQVDTEKARQSDISADISIKGKQGSLVDAQTATEGSKKLDVEADTTVKGKQSDLLETQVDTEKARQADISADISIKGKQGSLVDAQADTEGAKKTDVEADTTLKGKQGGLIDTQVDTEKARQSDISADINLKSKQGSLVDAQATDVGADTTLKGKQGGLIDTQVDTEKARQSDIGADISLKSKQGSLVDAQTTDVGADITLKGKQGSLVDTQVDTEKARQSDIGADISLKGKQGSLVEAQVTDVGADTALKNAQKLRIDEETDLLEQQFLTEQKETSKREAEESLVRAQTSKTFVEASTQNRLSDAEIDLKDAQTTKLTEETSYIVTEEKNYNNNNGVALAGVSGYKGYKDFRGELRIMGVQEIDFNALPAYKKKELLKDANAMRTSRAESKTSDLGVLNNILRYIGEEAVTNTSSSSLATEAHALMNKVNLELQSRGWWFNTETDVELNITNGMISYASTMLNIEVNDIPTTKQKVSNAFVLRNLETKQYNDWEGTPKATIIYQRDLEVTPQKFQEYVEVRTARLLTELYPQSGIDIQRLPKLEQELETYFKDRQNDQGNYNIFNNYDTATRVGVNRNYDLV